MQDKNIEDLIVQCKQGHQKAQMQIYDSYCDAMYNIACRYLNNTEDAKDAMQEAFLKAFFNIENYNHNLAFGAWLKRIVINHCIDQLRRKQPTFENIETQHLQVANTDDWVFDTRIKRENIVAAIDKLAEKYKLVINLYLIEGYTHEEISEILDIPVKTSRTQLRRAKEKLKELLKPHIQ